jgi:hypothetical protein
VHSQDRQRLLGERRRVDHTQEARPDAGKQIQSSSFRYKNSFQVKKIFEVQKIALSGKNFIEGGKDFSGTKNQVAKIFFR